MSEHEAVIDGLHFHWVLDGLGPTLGQGASLLSRVDPFGWKRCKRFVRGVFVFAVPTAGYEAGPRVAVLGDDFITEGLVVAVLLLQMGLFGWHSCIGGLDRDARLNELTMRLVRGASLRFARQCLDRGQVTTASFERTVEWLKLLS